MTATKAPTPSADFAAAMMRAAYDFMVRLKADGHDERQVHEECIKFFLDAACALQRQRFPQTTREGIGLLAVAAYDRFDELTRKGGLQAEAAKLAIATLEEKRKGAS